MTLKELTQQDLIDGARLPDKPGLYFVGPFTPRITFFSQQVRALRLARALHELKSFKDNETIGVVGAGAAGATISMALAMLGYRVTLFDQSADILHLQSGSTRLLHPHIYEWPQFGSLDSHAGLPILDWTAGPGSDVVLQLRKAFNSLYPSVASRLIIEHGLSLKHVEPSAHGWKLTVQKGNVDPTPRTFNHVFLTMGFGDEIPCGDVAPEDYWKPASVGTSATETESGTNYLVSGNGDGALTVALGLLVRDFDHAEFTREFLDFPGTDLVRDAAELTFANQPLDADLEGELRQRVLPLLCEYGVVAWLQKKLRDDRAVTINTNGPLFAAGKASQLNQCMVLALLEASIGAKVSIVRSHGYVSACHKVDAGFKLTGTSVGGSADPTIYKHAILRHGPNIKGRYGPVGDLIVAYQDHVRSLITLNPGFSLPPILDEETFTLFETARIHLLSLPGSLQGDLDAAEGRRRIIEVSIDRASGSLVERGCIKISDISLDCERLNKKHFIDLYIPPTQVPDARELVRLSRSSSYKIELRACKEVLEQWNELEAKIVEAPPPSSTRKVSRYVQSNLSQAVDQCLMRMLDQMVKKAVTDGGSLKLGAISNDILLDVATTWSQWKTSLDADERKRFDFLRWLANVDQTLPVPWNGDHGALLNMTNALIMIAATHSGEPLLPDPVPNGNLQFGQDGVVIGTGGEVIDLEPLSIRSLPDEWGADALILAAAGDVFVSDPPGTVLDGGQPSNSLTSARRVRPAIVQNSSHWLRLLKGPLAAWQTEVAAEFASWRARQDEELLGVRQ
jgi:hypothetical protein